MEVNMNEKWIDFIQDFDKYQENANVNLYNDRLSDVVRKPYYKAYLDIIRDIVKLFRELNINDEIDFSILYTYLLWNGYFSKDRELVYGVPTSNKLFFEGMDIMCGKSKCINNSRMLCDLLMYNGKFSCVVGVKTFENHVLNYKLDINRKILDLDNKKEDKIKNLNKLNEKGLSNAIANHAVTLFYMGDIPIMCDPTSLSFLYINDILYAKYIGSKNNVEIKPVTTIAINDISFSEVYNIFSNFKSIDEEQLLLNVTNRSKYIFNLVKENSQLLDDFYDSINSNILVVNRTLKK